LIEIELVNNGSTPNALLKVSVTEFDMDVESVPNLKKGNAHVSY